MAILSKGNTYSSGDSVTAANLNSLVDSATFVSGSNATTDNTSLEVHSGGYLQVKDDGVTNAKIATGAVNADSIAADAVGNSELANNAVQTANIVDSTGATDGITTAKIADDAITTAKIADGVEIKSTNIALYNSSSSTEGGQLLLNEPGVNSPVFSEAQSFSVDTFKDTANISGHGTNSKMLRIFQGSVSTSPTAFADNGNVSFSGSLFPTVTASEDLGTASLKWQDVYSSTGAFNGSDLNLKQDIEELSEAEKRVAVTAKGLLKKYRLKKAVEEKGSNARYHFGIIAQELQSAFQAEGLDPMRYGIIAENTWWEKTVDGKRSVSNDAQEGYSEITEMAVRYTELLAFIIAAL